MVSVLPLLLMGYIAGGLAGAPLMARLAIRIGKHNALRVAAISFSLGLCTILLPPKGMWLAALPINIALGFMAAAFEMSIRSMLADVADEVRLDQNRVHGGPHRVWKARRSLHLGMAHDGEPPRRGQGGARGPGRPGLHLRGIVIVPADLPQPGVTD